MKLHSTTIAILAGTLVIGIAIGALGWSTIHNQREERLREMRRQGGLYGYIDRYIDPVDSLQEQRLRTLTSAYQDTLSRFWRHYMWHRTELMKDLEADLLPELNEDQKVDIRPYLDRNTSMPESLQRNSTRNDTTPDSTHVGSAAPQVSPADSVAASTS
jgi:hypothetical protein